MKFKFLNIILTFLLISSVQFIYSAKEVMRPKDTSIMPLIKWAPVKGANKYKIVIKKLNVDGSVAQKIETATTTATSHQVTTTLTSGSIYKVTVKAKGTKANKLNFYIAPKEKRYRLIGSDFSPGSTNLFLSKLRNNVIDAGDDDLKFRSRIWANSGHVFYKMRVTCKDSTTDPIVVELRRNDIKSEDGTAIMSFTSNQDGNFKRKSTTTYDNEAAATVDTSLYTYLVSATLQKGHKIQQVEVFYYGETV